MSIRIVLADNHLLILQGLALLLRQQADFEVLACCQDDEKTLQAVRQLRPDILILDILMPGKDGITVLRELRQREIPTRVILLTAAIDEGSLREVLRLGVDGVVLKEMPVPFLIQCIRKVYAGGHWLERSSTSQAMEKTLRREAGTLEVAQLLTSRELDIVRLAASGLRNKEIADKLAISEGTVKLHLHRIYKKLHIHSRIALLRYAQAKGLV